MEQLRARRRWHGAGSGIGAGCCPWRARLEGMRFGGRHFEAGPWRDLALLHDTGVDAIAGETDVADAAAVRALAARVERRLRRWGRSALATTRVCSPGHALVRSRSPTSRVVIGVHFYGILPASQACVPG